MKRFIIVVGGGLVVLIVALIVALFFLYSSLDSVVKAAIEKIGSEVTGTAVRLDDVDISPTSGEGALRGFRVVNPEGFRDDSAFRFDEITVALDIHSITDDPVVIKEIAVVGPQINYDITERGTNVGAIQRNVEGYTGPEEESGGPHIVIENLYFRDGTVSVAASRLLDESMTVELPDIHLKDIGTTSGGVTAAEVGKRVMAALARKVSTAVASVDLEELQLDEESLEQAKDKAKEKINELLGKD